MPRAAKTASQTAKKTSQKLSPAVQLIALSLFLPEELSFFIGGLRFTLTRLLFILLTPLVLSRVGQGASTGRRTFVTADLLICLTSFWMLFAAANVVGIVDALIHTGPEVLEFFVAYFIMRTLITDQAQALAFIDLISLLIAIVALSGLLDTITSQYFTHDTLSALTGYVKHRQHDYRYNLLRAAGPIEHPIHFGMVCAFGVVLAVGTPVKARTFKVLACSLGLILSISTAPLQCAIMGVGLIGYDRVLTKFKQRWAVLIGLGLAVIATIVMVTNSPVNFIIEHLIFDASSGWYRVWEWRSASVVVDQHPFFGVAYEWPLIAAKAGVVESVDSLWLNMTLMYGYPSAILLALAYICAGRAPCDSPPKSAEAQLCTTLGIIIFLVIYLGFTVHIWAATWVLVSLLVGLRAQLGTFRR